MKDSAQVDVTLCRQSLGLYAAWQALTFCIKKSRHLQSLVHTKYLHFDAYTACGIWHVSRMLATHGQLIS